MTSIQKFLLFFFLILLIITSGELIYFLFFTSGYTKKTEVTKKIVVSPTMPSLNDKQKLLSLVSAIKTSPPNGIDAIPILNKLGNGDKCTMTGNCFVFNNSKNKTWYGKELVASNSAIPMNGPMLVTLALRNENDISGITLNGLVNSTNDIWWNGIRKIYIGVDPKGTTIVMDVFDGTSGIPVRIFSKTLLKPVPSFHIFFDEHGTHILVTDDAFNTVEFVNVNVLINNQPNGLFPNNQFYVGLSVAPLSTLTALQLSFATF